MVVQLSIRKPTNSDNCLALEEDQLIFFAPLSISPQISVYLFKTVMLLCWFYVVFKVEAVLARSPWLTEWWEIWLLAQSEANILRLPHLVRCLDLVLVLLQVIPTILPNIYLVLTYYRWTLSSVFGLALDILVSTDTFLCFFYTAPIVPTRNMSSCRRKWIYSSTKIEYVSHRLLPLPKAS